MRKLGIALSLLAALSLSLWAWAMPAFSQTAIVPIQTTITQVQASATGTTGAVSATMAAVSGQWNYICGFTITSGGTTSALAVTATITGLQTTMSYTYIFVSSGQGVLGVAFPACISSSATNTAIVVSVPGGGAGTTVAVNAWGYRG